MGAKSNLLKGNQHNDTHGKISFLGGRSSTGPERDLIIDQFPSFSEDPFIATSRGDPYFSPWPVEVDGYDPISRDEQLRTILGLHPDVLDFRNLPTIQFESVSTPPAVSSELDFSLQTGLPGTAGYNIGIPSDPEQHPYWELDSFMESNSWTYPDGTTLEEPTGILAETYDGEPHISVWTDELSIPSVFAPGTLDIMLNISEQRLSMGFSGLFLDGMIMPFWRGLDFSVWATDEFRNYLESLPEERLNDLGVDDPMSFDIKAYITENDLDPGNDTHPANDPLFREYALHCHLGLKRLLGRYKQGLSDAFPERMANGEIRIHGNQAFFGELSPSQGPLMYISEFYDHINGENGAQVRQAEDYVYKLRLALGGFEKPVLSEGLNYRLVHQEEFSTDQYYPMLHRFQMAEAYAMGAIKKIPLNGDPPAESIEYWIRADGTISERLTSFIDFLWTHKRFLSNNSPNNSVAVVYSLPDRIWGHFPQWDVREDDRERVHSFLGTVELLREAHIPYDVLVFGHPELLDDTEQLDRLPNYDAVVLPAVQCITDAQLDVLETYLSDGGVVVASGTKPSKSGMFESRTDVEQVFEADEAVVLGSNPGLKEFEDGSTDGSLVDTLISHDIPSLLPGSDPSLTTNLFQHQENPRSILHLLNHDYDPSDDSFAKRRDIAVRLPIPDHPVNVARYYSPQGTDDLDITRREDEFEVIVPELVEWGFVVFADTQEDMASSGSLEAAEEEVSSAKARLENDRQEGLDWSNRFTQAETRLQEAETALEHDAVQLAESRAKSVIGLANGFYRRPKIGVDLAHGQQESLPVEDGTSEPLEGLVQWFSQFEWDRIEKWDGDVLSDIDVLLIPPMFGTEFDGYSPVELDKIEAFVRNGGSLVVVAGGGMSSELNTLTERFGYRFFTDQIVTDVEGGVYGQTVNPRNELTLGFPELWAEGGTSLRQLPETATILSQIPKDSSAWLHVEEPRGEKSSRERSVASDPIYATSKYGDGRVALFGNHRYVTNVERTIGEHFEVVVGNLLHILGREAVESTSDSAPTTTSVETSTASPTPTGTYEGSPTETGREGPTDTKSTVGTNTPPVSTETPGFTLIIGLIGIVVSIVARVIANDDEQNQ